MHQLSLRFPPLSLLRARVRYRLLEATTLPPYKGALLRGGFGYAFQRTSCAPSCWNQVEQCNAELLCPYRWVFETPHPAGVSHLHDLRDLPRPFVIEPPLDRQRDFAVGDPLEFGLLLVGRGIDFLPYFLYGFAELGKSGLGRDMAKAHLEQVELLQPFGTATLPIYQDGRLLEPDALELLNLAELPLHGEALAADLRLDLLTPLRVKQQGSFIETFDLGAVVQAICWRINALATFHGAGPWQADYRPLVAAARTVRVESAQVQWVDWERTSHRGGAQRQMKLGGIIGSVLLRAVPAEVRTAILAAELLHVGKACVFGHGLVRVRAA